MTRYLKTLGLALVAVLALSALAASAASAGKLTLSAYPGALAGVQSGEANELVLEGGRRAKCGEVTYAGEYKESEVAEEMTVLYPQYKNCTATILGNVTPVTITTNGCTITLSVGTVSDATNATGKAHVRCPSGRKMEIHVWTTTADHLANVAAFCTYTIPEQTLTGTVSYKFDSAHNKLTAALWEAGLTVERIAGTLISKINCGNVSQAAQISTQATVTANKAGVELTGTFS